MSRRMLLPSVLAMTALAVTACSSSSSKAAGGTAAASSPATAATSAAAASSPAAAAASSPAAAAASAAAASSTTGGPYKLTELDVTPGYFYLPTVVIRTTTGAAHNLTVTASSVTGGGAGNTQFAGGQGDIYIVGMDSAVRFFVTKAVNVTILGTIVQTNPAALVSTAGSKYKTLADLKGKNIGIFGVGGVTDLAMRQQLKADNIDPSQVHLVALGAPAAQLAALQSGSAQAVQLTQPILGQELAAGKIQIVDDMRTQGYAVATVVARTAAVQKNPGAYCAYQAALSDAMQKLIKDPTFAASAGAAFMGPNVSAADNATEYQEAVQDSWDPNGKFTEAQYDSTKQILISSGAFSASGFPTYAQLTAGNPAC